MSGPESHDEEMSLRRVILETPFAGNVKLNIRYARKAMRDCLLRGEAPLASHLLYTQPGVLNDDDKHDRALGIEAGWIWRFFAQATVVYTDLGITEGMRLGVAHALSHNLTVEYRQLGSSWKDGPEYKTRWEG